MSSEGNVQFSSGSSILNPMGLGNAPPNLLGFPMGNVPQNGPIPGPPQGPISQQMHHSSVLKLTNFPSDLSQREAGLIFSLVSDDVLSIDLHDGDLTVAFKNPSTCLTAGRILDGKYIFGQNQGPAKVEFDASLALSNTTASFDSLRLSNAGISPPASQQLPQTSKAHSSSQIPHGDFQKRASIGNQRSRFLFSDPFSGATTPTNPNPGSIDLSDLTGKSLLLMKQNDGRDYDNLSRDPWASQSQGNIGFSSNPQTPGLSSVQTSYDWGATGNFPASSSASSQAQQPQNQAPSLQPSHSSSGNQQIPPYTTSAPADRRRTSSFFNGPTGHIQGPPGHEGQVQQAQQTSSQVQPPSATSISSQDQQPQHQGPQTAASIISQGPTQGGQLPPLSIPAGTPSRNGAISSGSQNSNPQAGGAQSTSATPTSARSVSKDVPDLSLLARVPPPANPADQNPPCNTLYVGNLPPDATETELRSLFSPQKGFRRLSFRTKNQSSGSGGGSSSHNHGPMCFVEFEDVAHATIALAELYGRALPRPNGSNGKGGIRLSFSKNPLGVRGPGNPRRTSTNPQPSSSAGASNGVGNYGYSNYH